MLRLIFTVVLFVHIGSFVQIAHAGDQWNCGGGCQVKRPSEQAG